MAAETITEEIIPAAETQPPASKPKAKRKAKRTEHRGVV